MRLSANLDDRLYRRWPDHRRSGQSDRLPGQRGMRPLGMSKMGAKTKMKALSVKQPWASMIASGQKTIELRSWQTRYRGDLIICASKRPDTPPPVGCALAIVNLVYCKRATQADEEKACCEVRVGRDFAWIFENIRKIRSWPVEGAQGLFNLPYEEEGK